MKELIEEILIYLNQLILVMLNLLHLDKLHLDLIQLNRFLENLDNNMDLDLAIDDFEHYQNNAK
jgi:hypothetical protein